MVSRQETARPLLTPGEIMQLPPNEEIVMVAGTPPIRATKARYFEDARLQERIVAPPPSPAQEFELLDDEPDVDAAKANAMRARMRMVARQASLDPGDGIEL